MRYFAWLVLLPLLLVIGCAAVKEARTVPEYNNPRIIYRDLSQPVVLHVPEIPMGQALPENSKPAETAVGNQPSYFIEFGNDSYKAFDEQRLLTFAETTPADATILVLGHSHGHSAVGTLILATKRAETVSRYLKGRGYTNVHAMAAWGGQPVSFSPNRGVQLYVLDAGQESELVSIAFSKHLKKEKHNGCPERVDNLADCWTAEGSFGDV